MDVKIDIKTFDRICPLCTCVIHYSDKYKLERAVKNNSVCTICNAKKAADGRKKIPLSEEHKIKISIGLKEVWSKTPSPNIGRKRSAEARAKQSLSISGKNHYAYGKTYEELFGEEKAKELKETHNKKIRVTILNNINKHLLNGGQAQPYYNPKACEYFNQLMKENGIYIQHAENGGEYHIKELGYFVDGYDEKNNVVYEFDEKRHFHCDGSYKIKDVNRQKEIEKYLNCSFVRIKESI